jgi:hypothetical protein
MIFPILVGVLAVYFSPLVLFIISAVSSRNFNVRSQLVQILVGMSEQIGRVRDIIATICVPILALFNVKLDRAAAFDGPTLALAGIFLGFALVSMVSFGICRAATPRLADYGDDYPAVLTSLMENYSRETLIYFAVMLGVSAGPALR